MKEEKRIDREREGRIDRHIKEDNIKARKGDTFREPWKKIMIERKEENNEH